MALIGTLRERMTKWVVGFVAVAIAAFVLNDLFGSGSRSVFNKGKNTVGEINGTPIGIEEYQNAIDEQKNFYILNLQRQPNETAMRSIRQQAWDRLILRYAVEPQYEEVDVKMTDDEEWDMIQGKNTHQGIKQAFTDSMGQFNRQNLMNYLKDLSSQPINSEPSVRWKIFIDGLRESRLQSKYNNLLSLTTYATQAEGEQEYHMQSDKASIAYLYVPFYSVADSLVSVSEDDLKKYYDDHKEKYEVDHTRSMKYVLFSIAPSADDSTALAKELQAMIPDFEDSQDDSLFAAINSDVSDVFASYSAASLPSELQRRLEDLVEGAVIGPFNEGDTYTLVKVVSLKPDTVASARASHILIPIEGNDGAARAKAQKILNDLKAGADFAQSAKTFSTDGAASRGGDLGWFSSGQMTPAFQEAVFNAPRTGLIGRLVKTRFGYHIINVTATRTNTSYTLATIKREIVAGDQTRNMAYRKADLFAGALTGVEAFEEKGRRDSITVYSAEEITPEATSIKDVDHARSVVIWLFRDAKKGQVSEVFDLGDNYMVAVMTDETPKGYKPLESIEEEVRALVKRDKKAAWITQKLNTLEGSLSDIASAYGKDAVVDSLKELKLSENTLPDVGLDPVAVGKAFALKEGERSKPFKGERGVLIMEMKSKTPAPKVGDYTSFTESMIRNRQNNARLNIVPAIKERIDIEDKRYLFY